MTRLALGLALGAAVAFLAGLVLVLTYTPTLPVVPPLPALAPATVTTSAPPLPTAGPPIVLGTIDPTEGPINTTTRRPRRRSATATTTTEETP